MLLFVAGIIIINIRKKRESQTSTLMRIFANYLQLMTAALNYEMNFPDIVATMFIPIQKVGSSTDSMLSFDCFAKDSNMVLFFPSNAILKVFLTAILPLGLFGISAAVWAMVHRIIPRNFRDYKRNVVVSTITVIFLLHPTLTEVSLTLFQCISIDDGDMKVRIDLTMECFSAEHIKW